MAFNNILFSIVVICILVFCITEIFKLNVKKKNKIYDSHQPVSSFSAEVERVGYTKIPNGEDDVVKSIQKDETIDFSKKTMESYTKKVNSVIKQVFIDLE